MRLVEAEQRLRWLSQKLIHTQEEERKSLSRELHDEIGQMLTGIRMVFGNLEETRATPQGSFKDLLTEGKGLAERTLQMVRNLALGLRPSMLDDLGLWSRQVPLPGLRQDGFSPHGHTGRYYAAAIAGILASLSPGNKVTPGPRIPLWPPGHRCCRGYR